MSNHSLSWGLFNEENFRKKNVERRLINMFTSYCIPQEIQSDRVISFARCFRNSISTRLCPRLIIPCFRVLSSDATRRQKRWFLSTVMRRIGTGMRYYHFSCLPFEKPLRSHSAVLHFSSSFGRKVKRPLKVIKDTLITSTPTPLGSIPTYLEQLRHTLTRYVNFHLIIL